MVRRTTSLPAISRSMFIPFGWDTSEKQISSIVRFIFTVPGKHAISVNVFP